VRGTALAETIERLENWRLAFVLMLAPSSSPFPLAGATVAIVATAPDAQHLRALLESAAWVGRVVNESDDLPTALEEPCGALLLAEDACSPPVLESLERALGAQPEWSDLPVLFLPTSPPKREEGASSGSERAQVALSRANWMALPSPHSDAELVATIGFTLRARAAQLRVRDLAQERNEEMARRDEFLAMLGHELRNPLAAIRYAVELLDAIDDAQTTRAPRGVIARQTRHLARLVDDLLDVARVTRGKISLNSAPLDLNEVARRSLRSLHDTHPTPNHDIELTPHSEALPIQGDAVRLEQVFANLLANALKYTPSGGKIEICLEREDDHARVVVQDNGVGMNAQDLPHVFDLFSQGAQTLDRSRGGLGIGLTLVRGLVELHGGRVEAHSEGIGRGSTFEIHLPLRASNSPSTAASPVPENASARTILIIEDNDDARHLFALLLEREGHHVEAARSGKEGLARLLELRPDIAFVDVGLPELDGYEVARQARQKLGNAVRLVAVTGYGQPEDMQRALEAGFDQHFVKPISPEQAREAIAHAG